MNSDVTVRVAGLQDATEVLGLINLVFKPPSDPNFDMAIAMPWLFHPDESHHVMVAEAAGQIVSLVASHRLAVQAGPFAYVAAHVGAMCTHPEWRGRGLATRLLRVYLDLLRSQGIDVAFISGGRGLYRRLGAVEAGTMAVFDLVPEANSSLNSRDVTSEDFSSEACLWALEPVTIARDVAGWKMGLSVSPDIPGYKRAVRAIRGEFGAYIVLDYNPGSGRAEVREYAGHRESVLKMARHVAAQVHCSSVALPVLATDSNLMSLVCAEAPARMRRLPVTPYSEWEATYMLLDPLGTARRWLAVAARLDPGLAGSDIIPQDLDRFSVSLGQRCSTMSAAELCQLFLGPTSPAQQLTPVLPVPMPLWGGLSYA